MATRRLLWISRLVLAICVLTQLAALALYVYSGRSSDAVTLLSLGYPVVGFIITTHQPRNIIGWVLLAGGASIAIGALCASIVFATLDADATRWQAVLAWITAASSDLGFIGMVLTIVFLFPTGHTLSPTWRGISIASVSAAGLIFVLSLFTPGTLEYFSANAVMNNPFGIHLVGRIAESFELAAQVVLTLIVLISLSAMMARVRRSRGTERLQLKWFALAVGMVGAVTFALGVANVLPDEYAWVANLADQLFFFVFAIGPPVAIGIAILRYRLYDIDRIISQTIYYGILTVLLVAIYLTAVIGFGSLLRALSGSSSSIVTAASTLLVAALVRPLRTRVQRTVDQRFHRRKYDAARTLEAFTTQLRNEVDLATVEAELQRIVQETVQPAYVSLWLSPVIER